MASVDGMRIVVPVPSVYAPAEPEVLRPPRRREHRTLDERLKAARSNLRFQDRRVADREARIAEPAPKS